MILGSVTYDRAGVETTVSLGTDGQWSCPEDPAAAELFDLLYRDDLDASGPQDGAYGAAVLSRAAEQLGGTSWYRTEPEPDGELVY